ncbi:MAG: type III pantothenate kinase [Sphingobacteriales bacterium]|nr:MAG: type III pantothenate kinase [Sphingobacteriales bacterium]
MNTVIDIGNTRVKAGFFDGNKLVNSIVFNTQSWQNLYSAFSGKSLGNCIVSSTVSVPDHVLNYFKAKADVFIYLDENTALPINNIYGTKNTLGKDRIALAVGAAYMFPQENALVINCGTCVTYNILNSSNEFCGGSISPGLRMRLQAMHTFTAQLPHPEIDEKSPIKVVGNSTSESLLSGAVNGLIFEMQGFIANIAAEYFPLQVIISGGDSRYLAEQFHIYQTQKIVTEPDLALIGLNQILQFNGKS